MSWWSFLAPGARESQQRDHPGTQALETAVTALQGRLAEVEHTCALFALHEQETRSTLDAHETRLGELLFAVSEGISKVERAEARIRATIRRAQEQLEDGGVSSPGLDAEAAELRLIDGGVSGPEPVQAVQSDLAGPDVTGIPGDFTPEDLALFGAG